MRFLSIITGEKGHNIIRNNCRRISSLNQTTSDTTRQSVDFAPLGPLDKNVKKKSSKVSKKASKESVEHKGVNKDGLDEHKDGAKEVSDAQARAVVLRKPIPKNFIKETLLPHLEHNVAYNCMKFPPEVVLQIGIAYSKLPHFIRQRSIEDALIESFRYRMVDYTAVDCIQLLNTCFQLQGVRSIAVYDDIISRLEVPHVFNSINSLNRLGICRSVAKIIKHTQRLNGSSSSNTGSTDSDGDSVRIGTASDTRLRKDDLGDDKQPSGADSNVDSSAHTNASGSSVDYTTKSEGLGEDADVKRDSSSLSFMNKDLFKIDRNEYHDLYKTSPMRPWSYLVKSHRDKKMASLVERMVSFCENRILPQLEYELKSFDADELTDLLAVLAQRTERDGTTMDFPVISILMANIMRLYESTSLVNTISNLASLCRLRIRHDEFVERLLRDLRNPLKVANIYHRHLSRCLWSLARLDLLNEVLGDLLPHVAQNVPKFGPSCLARLAQVAAYYPIASDKEAKQLNALLEKTCLCVLSRSGAFSPRDVTFLASALMHLRLLPTESEYGAGVARELRPKFEKEERYIARAHRKTDTLQALSRLLEALNRLDAEFDLVEIERLIGATRSFKEYAYLLAHFPESWRNIVRPPEPQ
ncbi:conserved hypothetical protein [Theileria orientalis strain Shintoku]|uniref:Uncharacterized protein n=1 Tax=Theileria orientalis strain Shintoku TaxID=869250 RepID=J4C952_THEOR|nr:conserved hypothetical protein [Theileria orientalis strain Shintoku]BAM41933.1 conserved hypothetical protein [Theileria orientalis strain Shintoku]|eukprot:XP_009692234.1 conserved hypothetical protein [Theileria orientalis strain Shintoku]